MDIKSPSIMGVVNITTDSFYDGGKYLLPEHALEHALSLVNQGADIIDIGAESTRPYATPVSFEQELSRVIPVIKKLKSLINTPISIDTSSPEVMQAAVKAGAEIINDVRALANPEAMAMAAKLQVPVCIMHMQKQPQTMQDCPQYTNVVQEVYDFLQNKIQQCLASGIKKTNIIIDPGFGFGKTLAHNLQLLKNLCKFKNLACPILVGISRKTMIGEILNLPVDKRLYGSIAAAVLAYNFGANILRVHDVQATVEAIKVTKEVCV